MNPLLTTKQETFRAGTDNLEFFRERLLKMNNGALMFCTRGEAIITIDLRKYHIVPNTHITLLPSSIISLTSASKDFLVDFFAYSETMFKTACFRLEPPFIHFIKENACYTHTEDEPVRAITGLITASNASTAILKICIAKPLHKTCCKFSFSTPTTRFNVTLRKSKSMAVTGKKNCSKSL